MCKNTDGNLNLALYFTIAALTLFNLILLLSAGHYWVHNPDLLASEEHQAPHDFKLQTFTHCIVYWKVPTKE
jgi:hypothetical protein